MKSSVLSLVALFILGPHLAGSEEEDVSDIHRRGMEAYRRRDLDEAERLLRSIIDRTDDGQVAFALCRVMARKDQIDEALTLFARAVDAGWNDSQALFASGALRRLKREPAIAPLLLRLRRAALQARVEDRGGLDGIATRRAQLDRIEEMFLNTRVAWQDGHTAVVKSVEFSADGRRLVTSSVLDDTARLWDAYTGEQIAVLGRHADPTPVFDATGERVLIHDTIARRASLWDGASGQFIGRLPYDERFVHGAVFDSAGSRVATWTLDGGVQFHGSEGAPLAEAKLDTWLVEAAFTLDGAELIGTTEDGRVVRVDAGSAAITELPTQEPMDRCLLSPNDRDLILTSLRGDVSVLSRRDPTAVPRPLGIHIMPPSMVKCSADGELVVSMPSETTLEVWSTRSGERLHEFQTPQMVVPEFPGYGQMSIAFHPDRTRLAVICVDAKARLFDLTAGGLVAELGDMTAGRSVLYNPSGSLLASAEDGYKPLVWDGATGEKRALLDGGILGSAIDLAFDPRGERLAVGSYSNFAAVYDVAEPDRFTMCGSSTHRMILRLEPGSDTVLTSGSKWPSPIEYSTFLWDASTGAPLSGFTNGKSYAFLNDGSGDLIAFDGYTQRRRRDGSLVWKTYGPGTSQGIFVSADDERILGHDHEGDFGVFRVSDGEMIHRRGTVPPSGTLHRAATGAFSPVDSRLIAHPGTEHDVILWEDRGESVAERLRGHTSFIRTVGFSADGKRVFSVSHDRTARIWDVATRAPLVVLEGHTDRVYDGLFSADGAEFYSCGFDATVRRWDAHSGELLHTFRTTAAEQVYALALDETHRRLVAGGGTGEIRVWNLDRPDAEPLTLEGHTAGVYELHLGPHGNRLYSLGEDHTARVWDLVTGELRLTRVHYGAEDWVAFTPQGYYLGTEGAADIARIVVENRRSRGEWPLSSYASILNDPDAVKASLTGTPVRPPFLPPAPTLDIDAPKTGRVDARDLTLEATVDDRAGIERVSVWQDGRPMDPDRVADAVTELDDGRSARISLRFEIPSGLTDTNLVVRATNRRGIHSRRERIRVVYEPPTRDLYLLAMGVADYEDDTLDLRYPVNDVDDMIERMRREEGALYREVHVERLVNDEVSGPRIRRLREKFLHRAGPEDTIIVFAAGHGVRADSGEYYYLTPDATVEDPYFGVERSQLESLVTWDRLAAQKRVMLIDTCHSGTVLSDGARGSAVGTFQQEEVDTAAGEGLYILAASSNEGLAREREGNGLFTRALVDGLDGEADKDGNGVVDIEELMDYTSERVKEDSQGRQSPTTPRVVSGDPFVLTRVKP